MPFEYSSYIDAIDGYNLTTTIDSTVQSFLEEELAATVEKHNVTNRACGIVMDVNTGAILGMAVSSPFDLNDPWQLDETSQSRLDRLAEEGYDEKSDEYNDLSRELLTTMWSNKAVTESYIPGSTFKIITSSMALEEKVVSFTESVNCPGHKTLFGHTIHCNERKGHGSLSFSQGLQQSCNVWFMTLGERIGVERYQDYVEIFGYRDKTGIDLPGEGNSIFASQMTELDLAIYAFGQNFTVTPIQQITAVASVANGGELLSPYLVEKISDNAGNVIYAHETEQKRETISEDTCKIISQILEEGVSGDGGAKNAYVAGYRVAAKTGTSEKKERECPKCGSTGVPKTVGEDEIVYVCSICKFTADVDDFPVSEKYICSTVAYAPADDPQIAVLIMVDEPTRGSLYGSTVAAPYVRNVLKNSLPYLGVEARYTQEELEKMRIKVANYKNRSVEGAISSITDAGLRYKVIGEGEYVTSQLPEAGTYIEEASGTIVLYASSSPNNTVTVPDLNGMVAATANQALINLNLNVRIEGADSYLSGTGYKVISQSVKAGEKVAPGTVITLTFKKSGS
jgi:stage V sporulation protein D (sporulation-specific penicillin-binding protein)